MSKKELVIATKPRYLKASKAERSKILDEFCQNTGYNRKYAIQIFSSKYDYTKCDRIGRKKRKKIYSSEVIGAAIKIWELLEYPCGARLKPQLIPMAESLNRAKEIIVEKHVKLKLKKISARTLDRRLEKERAIKKLNRSRGTTRHGTLLKSSIPIRITDWDTSKVGFMEIDTVAHNGGDPSGEFIYSLDMVEIYSGWSEQYAVMGKGEIGIKNAINIIKNELPFNLLGLDSDSGGEFINWHLVKYCEANDLYLTRSRPDRKNDNAYVEQKNNTHIRHWLGYGRYDQFKQQQLINDLYRKELRLFNNFFRPVMKIAFKEKVNNSICRKIYDQAKTPYQRLMASDQITKEDKRKLRALYLSLNPVQLKKALDEKIKIIKKFQSLTK